MRLGRATLKRRRRTRWRELGEFLKLFWFIVVWDILELRVCGRKRKTEEVERLADRRLHSWDDATIAERYSGEVGEEYKERLACKVEGREYVPGSKPAPSSTTSRSQTPRSQTPQGARLTTTSTSAPSALPPGGKAKVDDKYFAGLGAANASRPDDLPPSQGGKYAGFGSQPVEAPRREAALPGFEDLQKDPVAALSKGFGWFTNTVGKTAKSVNEGWVQPTAAKVCSPSPSPIS
jgi:ADP-ribosylation factor GTPase-activating protein 1